MPETLRLFQPTGAPPGLPGSTGQAGVMPPASMGLLDTALVGCNYAADIFSQERNRELSASVYG